MRVRLKALLLLLVAASAGLWAGPLRAVEPLGLDLVQTVFPGAERAGPLDGTPPAAPVYRNGQLAGYVFRSFEAVGSTGYSGKPISVLVGLGLDGRITGARLVDHQEPILAIGISDARLREFTAAYRDLDVRAPLRVTSAGRAGSGQVDAIGGATITSIVLNDAIMRSARSVARSRGLFGGAEPGAVQLDLERYETADWAALRADGSLVSLRLSNGDVVRQSQSADAVPGAAPDDLFIEMFLALATPARIGRNLLGDRIYGEMMNGLAKGEQALLIAAHGRYSFKGTAFVQTGVFDRVQIVQGTRTIRLQARHHRLLASLRAPGAPDLREIGLFTLPADSGFDPLKPWRLDLLVESGEGASRRSAGFALAYQVPAIYISASPAGPVATAAPGAAGMRPWADDRPLWQQTWLGRIGLIAVLSATLAALMLALFFHDWIAARPRLYQNVRLGFLAFTLLFLGWYGGVQLSVINVLTFANALLSGFRWEFFLLDPLMFIMWSFVAVAMLFWGRGVYCGWLCPFGALLDLVNRIGRWLKVPQLKIPFLVHERLWPIKYVVFLGLLALSLQSLEATLGWIEIEPFKTAVVLKFVREWPYVIYALAVIGTGLFVERAYCRYLCPLGAALALPARLRMFEWLNRRRQCGTECQTCAVRCPVQAIHPLGNINPNECIYCLNCQVLYYDEKTCPPLIDRRKRREARAAAVQAAIAASAAASAAGSRPPENVR